MNLARILGIGLSVATLAMPASRAFAADEAKPARPAAGGNRIGAMIAERVKGLSAQLDLTDDQKKKVDEIAAEAQKKAGVIEIGGPDAREKSIALREDTIKQIKAILTPEQLKKLEALLAQQPAGGRGAGGPTALVQLLQTAVKDLDLNEEQKTKMNATFADAQKKFEEVRAELTSGKATPETREKLRTIFDSLRGDIEKVLTPEQQEKLRNSMQNRNATPPASGKKDL